MPWTRSAQVAAPLVTTGPRALAREGGGGLPAGVGQVEGASAVQVVGLDEALVLELLEGGVDGAGAGSPATAAARLELLHDLVAVHRLFGEKGQDGGPQGTATGLRSEPPGALGVLAPMAPTSVAAGMTMAGVVAGLVVVSMAAHAADRRVGGVSDGQGFRLLSSDTSRF